MEQLCNLDHLKSGEFLVCCDICSIIASLSAVNLASSYGELLITWKDISDSPLREGERRHLRGNWLRGLTSALDLQLTITTRSRLVFYTRTIGQNLTCAWGWCGKLAKLVTNFNQTHFADRKDKWDHTWIEKEKKKHKVSSAHNITLTFPVHLNSPPN